MNHSVIELAQLLTQALDENFNIRNQSAVVKVVTCLEAFNITHESYREVQNTRIIKDLQALRQNKANDQVLAKRIKNLLRKWKERLASTIPSQPNSPQNISQGSSDTQFMTQQSQSPPISQTPRLVNGPTSFKNLLPKSQNHHHFHQTKITSPVVPNGINYHDSSSSHQQQHLQKQPHHGGSGGGLLGKRKMPYSNNTLDVSNASNDIDENSNHNRMAKMMRKSENFTGNSSSHILNANNNSNSQQQQQQINHKLHNSNVPVTPQQTTHKSQQQQQQQPQLQQQSQKSIVAEQPPQPKKRGRRKGSRGFDATLNGNIPDFQAEIQQKIALSAGKRNKTTFELQQMLESHQSTNASWTNGDVHHDSNSFDRVNFTASSNHPVESSTAFKNFDSLTGKALKKEVTDIKREPIDEALSVPKHEVDSTIFNNNSSISKKLSAKNELTPEQTTIEDEIAQLYSKLPPIDLDAALRARFDDLNTYDERGEVVECTCTFREVITYADEEEQTSKANTNGFISDETTASKATVNMNGDSNKNNINNNNSSNVKPEHDTDGETDEDDDETDDFCAVEDIIVEKSPPRPSAVKSIFDPEYDANENLIEEMMVRRKTTAAAPKIIEVKIEKDAVKSSRIESMMNSNASSIPEPTSIQQMERVPIITYVCDEDPECPAREHFRRPSVTLSDVERLHDSFINGVNGYWNGIMEELQQPDYSKDSENIDYAKLQLWKRVVPRYNFLTLDKIPKTFDDNSPYSIPPPPPPETSSAADAAASSDDKKESLNDGFSLHKHGDIEFREWHEVMNVRSYNDEVLTILPYVVID